jgi:hypothetical protein
MNKEIRKDLPDEFEVTNLGLHKKESKFQENLKKERAFERKKRAITNFIYGFCKNER